MEQIAAVFALGGLYEEVLSETIAEGADASKKPAQGLFVASTEVAQPRVPWNEIPGGAAADTAYDNNGTIVAQTGRKCQGATGGTPTAPPAG